MVRSSVMVWLACASVASAADVDADGCQDEYEGNGACVDVHATVDPSTTVGANTQVMSYATVGPEVALGADVTVASRASLAGRASSPDNPVTIGDGSFIGRRAVLGADHTVGADVTIGRAVEAGPRLQASDMVSVGYGTTMGSDVTLEEGATIGSLVTLGDYTTVGTGAVVARSVTVADGAGPGQGTAIHGVVGPDVSIGAGVDIELGARVRKEADIQAGAVIAAGGRVGRGATIGANAIVYGRVSANALVGAGATVEDGAVVARGGEVCAGATVPDGASVLSAGIWPVDGCTVSSTCKTIRDTTPGATSGIYSIDPDGLGGRDPFDAWCDMDRNGGGWTLVMQNNIGVTSPSLNWAQSTGQLTVVGNTNTLSGFDTVVGLDLWQEIGTEGRIEMGNTAGVPEYQAVYTQLELIGSNYTLTLSGQSLPIGGTAPGLYVYHNGRSWSASDRDNDVYGTSCYSNYGTAWWYGACWSGSLWGYSVTQGPYWDSSSAGAQRNWGAIWLR